MVMNEDPANPDTETPEHAKDEGAAKNKDSKNPHGLGSPPSANIADGGEGGARQPKEHTGKDSDMGGATGGTSGMGSGSSNQQND